MTAPTFFQNPVCLDKERHRHSKVTPVDHLSFIRRTDSLPITTSEFFAAAKHYPIAFAQGDEEVVPLALFSMRQSHNAFLDSGGQWLSQAYLPLIIRGYPFYPATTESDDEIPLLVDETALHSDSEKPGPSLFTESGTPSEYLSKVQNYFARLQAQQSETKKFGAVLHQLHILEISPTQFKAPDGKPGVINELLTVNREALHALPESQLGQLAKDGLLEWIYLHLNSLRNIDTLIARTRSSGLRRSG